MPRRHVHARVNTLSHVRQVVHTFEPWKTRLRVSLVEPLLPTRQLLFADLHVDQVDDRVDAGILQDLCDFRLAIHVATCVKLLC